MSMGWREMLNCVNGGGSNERVNELVGQVE